MLNQFLIGKACQNRRLVPRALLLWRVESHSQRLFGGEQLLILGILSDGDVGQCPIVHALCYSGCPQIQRIHLFFVISVFRIGEHALIAIDGDESAHPGFLTPQFDHGLETPSVGGHFLRFLIDL